VKTSPEGISLEAYRDMVERAFRVRMDEDFMQLL
jgi:hypothetical protein